MLRYRVLGVNGGCSLVRIRLLTGRTHQIRAQFAAIGCPLVGDAKYGGPEGAMVALWSAKLRFRQPYSGEILTFEKLPCGGVWDLFSL